MGIYSRLCSDHFPVVLPEVETLSLLAVNQLSLICVVKADLYALKLVKIDVMAVLNQELCL